MPKNSTTETIKEMTFYKKGTFESYYEAKAWAHSQGYSYGSTDCGGIVALRKGEYDLPQKWKNISDEGRTSVDGILFSDDFREGIVKIHLYK